MTEDEIIDLFGRGLRAIRARRTDVDIPPLHPDAALPDLGIDSIEFIEALSYVEEELGAMLSSERLSEVRTIGDLVRLVQSELGPSHLRHVIAS